ncbi:MAG: hypothetical protein ACAI25_00600 [Planctomycetota bacterium]
MKKTLGLLALCVIVACTAHEVHEDIPDWTKVDLQSEASTSSVGSRTAGCVKCHVGQTEPHADPIDPTQPGRFAEKIGCTDCHGGDAMATAKEKAHILPRFPELWKTTANPKQSYTALEKESWEFVRFINPGDLRVANYTCGTAGCHGKDAENHVLRVQKSMMAHGSMLWEAALYNNGSYPNKNARFAESYGPHGEPQRILANPMPTVAEVGSRGLLTHLDPLPRFEIGQPSNILRIFEEGQKNQLLIGLPTSDEEPGRPANRLSPRGYGTLNRIDPVWLNLQRTRLLDPTLNMLGTNDHAGDYRSSGCTACHTPYANDRDYLNELRGGKPEANHSGPYAKFGNRGTSQQPDPTIPKDEPGHPIQHILTRRVASSTCVVCHMHPGTAVEQTYLGYTWWDLETDGKHMWPAKQKYPTPQEELDALSHNPEGSTPKGNWNDAKFLEELGSPEFNKKLDKNQMGDFHGHGFVFRAVWKRDKKGALLDDKNQIVADDDPERWKKAVHLKDIHLEKGMHCTDCHFTVDEHGDGKLYGELRAATAIKCQDCHGSIDAISSLKTTGNAGGQDLLKTKTPYGPRFRKEGNTIYQHSTLYPELEWEVPQVKDTITPGTKHYNEKSRMAKTMRRNMKWGDVPEDKTDLAHSDKSMECYACHSSWMASCFGCHLNMKANQRRPALHYEGEIQRNWTTYSWQTLRDDIFMLGKDGTYSGGKTVPVRSACAVTVGSQNGQRENVYSQQQTISAEGYSGTAFSPHFPHTVRSKETKTCTSCHASKNADNNAYIAQLLMLGTNAVNFIGRYCYVASGDGGVDVATVTESGEPQAVIGSRLHELAWPDQFKEHAARNKELTEGVHHSAHQVAGVAVPFGSAEILQVQLRGEYLYAACGSGGLRVYDVAQIDQKGFSEKIVTAPVSPLGQDLTVSTTNATSVKAPSTQGVDPTRTQRKENQEQPIHLSYAFLYVTDSEEGLILVSAATLLDGDPKNNFLERAVTFNPGNALKGAVNCTVAGTNVYVCCDKGIVVVSVEDPLNPKIVGQVELAGPKSIEVQFRFGFVADKDGLTVLDLSEPTDPKKVAALAIPGANSIYVCRTTGYLACGPKGIAIVDLTTATKPVLIGENFTANGQINDARDVKTAMTNASLYAYVADGKNGLRILQLTSADEDAGAMGYALTPRPRLIATYKTHGPALWISEGIDRDRAVDESGNQTAVFGRVGSRPFNADELRMFFRLEVSDEPPGKPLELKGTVPPGETLPLQPGPKKPGPPRPGQKPPKPGEQPKEEPKETPKEEPKEEPKQPGPKKPGPPRPGQPPKPGGSKPAETPKTEEPKAEEPKAEEPKPGPKKPGQPPRPGQPPKPGAPKPAEEPKKEEPKAEEPKKEEPKAEEPKAEAPKPGPKKPGQPPRPGQPKPAEPKPAEPKAEEPKPAEEPKAEEPKPAEAPK